MLDLFTVLEHTDKEIVSLVVLPLDFYEPQPSEILQSLRKHDSKEHSTSIQQKYQDGKYDSNPYALFHDIKVACSVLISKESPQSYRYKEVDFFYKFSTELLLRETGNLVQIITTQSNTSDLKNELESHIEEEFDKIISDYSLSNGEIITYMQKIEEKQDPQNLGNIYDPNHHHHHHLHSNHQHLNQLQIARQKVQPLFTSVLNKSSLDQTPTLIKEPYGVAKVVPSVKDTRTNSTLESLSPVTGVIPSPLEQPTNILHDFFHPTWYTVAMPTWLTYKAIALQPKNVSYYQKDGLNELPQLSILQQPGNAPASVSATVSASASASAAVTAAATTVATTGPFWGSGNNFRSFAPQVDTRASIVADKIKSNIWLSHIGNAAIERLKAQFVNEVLRVESQSKNIQLATKTAEGTDNQLESTTIKDDVETKGNMEHDDQKVESEKKMESVESEGDSKHEVNLANLIKWDPTSVDELEYLKSHKKDLLSPQKLQKLISISLLKMNALRQERYFKSDVRNPLPPDRQEIQLYKRVQELILLAVKLYKVNPGDFSFKFSQRIPVLVSEYSGVLPGVAPNKISSGSNTLHSGRSSVRGPNSTRGKKARYQH